MQASANKRDSLAWESHYSLLSDPERLGFASSIVSQQRVTRQRILKRELAKIGKSAKVAELGCGEALDLASLSGADVEMLLAVDYSPTGCSIARDNTRNAQQTTVIRADITRLPFIDEALDFVFSSGVLEHFENPHEATKEYVRILHRRGKVVTFVPNRSSLWSVYRHLREILSPYLPFVPPWPVWEMSFTMSEMDLLMMESGFEIEESFGVFISHVLIPLELLVKKIGGDLWRTRFGRALRTLVARFERNSFLCNLLGMEICQIAHRA